MLSAVPVGSDILEMISSSVVGENGKPQDGWNMRCLKGILPGHVAPLT